jgi:hypothetical protein
MSTFTQALTCRLRPLMRLLREPQEGKGKSQLFNFFEKIYIFFNPYIGISVLMIFITDVHPNEKTSINT